MTPTLPRWVQPWQIVLVFILVYLGAVLAAHEGDPGAFVRMGYGPNQGYDGQFTYLIATSPDPSTVSWEIGHVRADAPAYRYQRILLPVMARLAGAARPDWIVWTIPLINVAAQVVGTALVTRLLASLGISPWYALVYGLWPGLLLGVRANLTEPLSYALIAAAYVLHGRNLTWLSAFSFALALFAKETAMLFVIGHAASAMLRRDHRTAISQLVLVVLPFVCWQLILRAWFGEVGLGSGGYLGTPFEVIPFNGLWRIAGDNFELFLVFALVLGPAVVYPAVSGISLAVRECLRRNWHPYVMALAVNATLIPFTPFSTFREPGAMLRLSTGLVLSTVLFAASRQSDAILNRSVLWLTLLVFLLE